jgi:sugar transferase (PEP-CTERM/EpsH1 system associated)
MPQILPTIAHLIYRFDIGGLERVMVNCINAMDSDKANHVVIALTEASINAYPLKAGVPTYQLNKKQGLDFSVHWKLYKLLTTIRPDVLHTYNLATIEYHPIAFLAGIKGSIHAEHGRDASDPFGLNKKHNLLRKFTSPFIDYFVPVSTDLKQWLENTVCLPKRKVILIRNGIDTEAFRQEQKPTTNLVNFIHIARLDKVKDQANLITAFSKLVKQCLLTKEQVTLTIVGDGAEMNNLIALTKQLEMESFVRFTGAQDNIPNWLQQADVFVLSSIAEGIPMTVLEAMAAGLPVISTDVGGLSELVENEVTGLLVDKQNSEALKDAMAYYLNDRDAIIKHGKQANCFVQKNFSESNMVKEYLTLYGKSLGTENVRD